MTSIDFEEPETLEPLDLYNEIRKNDVYDDAAGHSKYIGSNLLSNKFNFINYNFTTLFHKENIKNTNHRNYIIGSHIAHEFIHQIMGKCLEQFIVIIEQSKETHCTDTQNLMFPGDGHCQDCKTPKKFYTDEEKKALSSSKGHWHALFTSGSFFPLTNNPNQLNRWERIPNSYKYVISAWIVLHTLNELYGAQSQEVCCATKIFYNIINKKVKSMLGNLG